MWEVWIRPETTETTEAVLLSQNLSEAFQQFLSELLHDLADDRAALAGHFEGLTVLGLLRPQWAAVHSLFSSVLCWFGL